MSYAFAVELDARWAKMSRVLEHEVRPLMEETQAALVVEASREGERTAKEFLDFYVYDAPLPPSAADTWGGIEHYLERSRIGRTRDAVKSEVEAIGETAISKAYVDPVDYEAYFYARSLEFGMEGKFPTYYPRPFWRRTIEVMKELYGREGELAIMKVAGRLNGRFA